MVKRLWILKTYNFNYHQPLKFPNQKTTIPLLFCLEINYKHYLFDYHILIFILMLIGSLPLHFRIPKRKNRGKGKNPTVCIAIQPLICTISVKRIVAVAGSWNSIKEEETFKVLHFYPTIISLFLCFILLFALSQNFYSKQEVTHQIMHRNQQRHVHVPLIFSYFGMWFLIKKDWRGF